MFHLYFEPERLGPLQIGASVLVTEQLDCRLTISVALGGLRRTCRGRQLRRRGTPILAAAGLAFFFRNRGHLAGV